MSYTKAFVAAVLALWLAACGPLPSSTDGTGTTVSGTSSSTTGTAACAAGTWASVGRPFFTTNCNGCHNFSSLSAVQGQSSTLANVIESGRMPPRGGPSDSERTTVVDWLNCGAPQ